MGHREEILMKVRDYLETYLPAAEKQLDEAQEVMDKAEKFSDRIVSEFMEYRNEAFFLLTAEFLTSFDPSSVTWKKCDELGSWSSRSLTTAEFIEGEAIETFFDAIEEASKFVPHQSSYPGYLVFNLRYRDEDKTKGIYNIYIRRHQVDGVRSFQLCFNFEFDCCYKFIDEYNLTVEG